jgi:hypothetical protein
MSIYNTVFTSDYLGHFPVALSFVWALRAKIADRDFASRQSASLVPVERGKLRNLLPQMIANFSSLSG